MSSLVRDHLGELATRLDYMVGLQALVVGLSLVLVYWLARAIYNIWLHPLSHLPGPPFMACFYGPFLYHNNVKGDMVRKSLQLHSKYGPIVRVGPNHIALDGSVAWPEVYAHRQAGKIEYSKPKNNFFEGDHNSIINAPRDVHRRLRRQLSHAFSDAALKQHEAVFNSYIGKLLDSLAIRARDEKLVNLVDWMNFTTFDIIGDLIFSEPFACLDTSNYHPWALSIAEGARGAAMDRFLRNYPLLKLISQKLGLSAAVQRNNKNRVLAANKAKDRMKLGLEAKEGHKDFMTYMLRNNRDGEQGCSDLEIMATSSLIVGAGSETTATAMSGLCFILGTHPEIYKTLTEEIRSAFDSESSINLLKTAQLEFLDACLEEILRIYPPAGETPPRVSPGDVIAGHYIPAQTRITTYMWSTYRNPKHFAEPHSFIPERWFPETHPRYDARFKNDNKSVFKPFSFGPRDCIGKSLAYSEMRLTMARLLYRFDFELAPGHEDWLSKQRAFVIWEKGPLEVRLRERRGA